MFDVSIVSGLVVGSKTYQLSSVGFTALELFIFFICK